MEVFTLFFILTFAVFSHAEGPVCPADKEVHRYPYEGNCTLFWQCYDGNRFLISCRKGKEFDAKTLKCDDPAIAKCDPHATSVSVPSSVSTNNPTSIITSTRPPNTTSRSTSRSTSTTTVSTSISTNPTTDVTSSISPITTSSTNPTTSDPGPKCPYPSNEIIYYPMPGDCRYYVECFRGNKYFYRCPEGLHWHPEKKQCDYPGPFCKQTLTSTVPPIKTSSSASSSTANPIDCSKKSLWALPHDCSKYAQCISGNQYVIISCPDGTFFSATRASCVFPIQSECCRANKC